jgi:hypothetical protein
MRTRKQTPKRVYGIQPVDDDIKIEKGIPCPPRSKYNSSKYPWRTMEVGDSFLFPKDLNRQTCYQSGVYHNNRHGDKRFVVRSTPEGYRCWRVS